MKGSGQKEAYTLPFYSRWKGQGEAEEEGEGKAGRKDLILALCMPSEESLKNRDKNPPQT